MVHISDLSIPNAFSSGTSIVAAQMNANFDAIETIVNTTGVPLVQDATVTTPKLATGLAQQVGLTGAGASDKRRGYVSIATEQSTTSTSYTELTTPDEITSVVVPAGGLLRVRYLALWKLTGASNAGAAAIFIGSNQVKESGENAAPVVSEAPLFNTGDNYGPLFTGSEESSALSTLIAGVSTASDSSFVTTGMVGAASTRGYWSAVDIYVAPGTYDISIRFKVNATSGGTLYVKERQLWVESIGFA